MYVLHNLHVQPTGVHCLILALNSFNVSDFLIESGRRCHVFWPRYVNDSVPNPTVLTLWDCQHLWLRRLYMLSYIGKSSCIGAGISFLFILNISTASFCKFLWWVGWGEEQRAVRGGRQQMQGVGANIIHPTPTKPPPPRLLRPIPLSTWTQTRARSTWHKRNHTHRSVQKAVVRDDRLAGNESVRGKSKRTPDKTTWPPPPSLST